MHLASEIVKWCVVAVLSLGMLSTTASIGKPRPAMTADRATGVVAVQAAFIVIIIIFWGA